MNLSFQERRERACGFCVAKKKTMDYKDLAVLKPFLSEWGKIVPGRISGNCAKHQKQLTRAIKRARQMAFIAFAEER